MVFDGTFEVKTEDGTIELHSSSFKVDRGSVLHSGIFNKELAASFLAGAVIVSYLIAVAVFGELRLAHYIIAAFIFIVIFPLSRLYVFREPRLITMIDTGTGTVTLTLQRPYGRTSIQRPLASMEKIDVDHVRVEPENPDGIAVVEKIALQHGTVIPGFGEVAEFFSVVLDFGKERYTVLTTSVEDEARSTADTLRKYSA